MKLLKIVLKKLLGRKKQKANIQLSGQALEQIDELTRAMREAAANLKDLEQAGIVKEREVNNMAQENKAVFTLSEQKRMQEIRKNMNLYGGDIKITIFDSPANSEQFEADIWFLLKMADKAERVNADRHTEQKQAQEAENE